MNKVAFFYNLGHQMAKEAADEDTFWETYKGQLPYWAGGMAGLDLALHPVLRAYGKEMQRKLKSGRKMVDWFSTLIGSKDMMRAKWNRLTRKERALARQLANTRPTLGNVLGAALLGAGLALPSAAITRAVRPKKKKKWFG